LAQARAILADPVRDMAYLATALGPDIDAHQRWLRLAQGSPKTRESRLHILARLAVNLPPGVGVADIAYEHLELYFVDVPEGSWRMHRSHINQFLEWAINDEPPRRAAKNPVRRLPKLRPKHAPVHEIFSAAEQAALVNASRFMDDPPHDRARVRLLLDSGIRKGEAQALKVGDVDPLGRCVTVMGKGNKPRLIPIRGEFWEDWEIFLIAPIPKLGWPLEPTDYVWFPMRVAGEYQNRERQVTASYPGKPMVDSGFHGWWVRLCGHAGIDYRKLHMTRHTFATDLLDASEGDIYGVSNLLGHASTKTTEIYLHSSKRRMESVVDKLDRARRDP
jgi:integrase